MFGAASEVLPEKRDRLIEALRWLSDYVKVGGFVAGSHFTLGDISILSTYGAIVASEVVDLSQVYKKSFEKN